MRHLEIISWLFALACLEAFRANVNNRGTHGSFKEVGRVAVQIMYGSPSVGKETGLLFIITHAVITSVFFNTKTTTSQRPLKE